MNLSRCCEAPGVFISPYQKQYIMRLIKRIFGYAPVKEELKESAIGAVCVWVVIALLWLTLKILA